MKERVCSGRSFRRPPENDLNAKRRDRFIRLSGHNADRPVHKENPIKSLFFAGEAETGQAVETATKLIQGANDRRFITLNKPREIAQHPTATTRAIYSGSLPLVPGENIPS